MVYINAVHNLQCFIMIYKILNILIAPKQSFLFLMYDTLIQSLELQKETKTNFFKNVIYGISKITFPDEERYNSTAHVIIEREVSG